MIFRSREKAQTAPLNPNIFESSMNERWRKEQKAQKRSKDLSKWKSKITINKN